MIYLPQPPPTPPEVEHSITLLGSFALCYSSAHKPITFHELKAHHAEHLLVLLGYVAQKGHTVKRSELAEALWYEAEALPEGSGNNLKRLRDLLYKHRAVLYPKDLEPAYHPLMRNHNTLAFNKAYRVDIATFEALATQANTPEAYCEALALYRGYVLSDVTEKTYQRLGERLKWWLTETRQAQQALMDQTYEKLVSATQHQEPVAALNHTLNWLQVPRVGTEMLPEKPLEFLLMLLALQKTHGGAARLESADRIRTQTLLQQAHEQLKDASSPAEKALYHRVARFLEAPKAHIRRIPESRLQFFGRQRELQDLERLTHDKQMVTLWGMGGLGKTALATRLGNTLAEKRTFSYGVTFVTLDTTPPAQFLEKLWTSLTPDPPPPPERLLSALTQLLHDQHLLLILDNFEHLTDQRYHLETLMSTLPNLHLLVTSRTTLQLVHETTYPLTGLSSPSETTHHQLSSAESEKYAAVQLFVDRARLIDPWFALTQETTPLVLELCHMLYGVPLALELASASLITQGLAEVVEALRQTLKGLEDYAPDVPARQHSLQASFDYAWSLLPEPLQTLYSALSIFGSSFSKQAARAISKAKEDQLDALVQRSLLLIDTSSDSERYHIHSMLHEFAYHHLQQNPQRYQKLKRGLAYYYGEQLAQVDTLPNYQAQAALRHELRGDIYYLVPAYQTLLDVKAYDLVAKGIDEFANLHHSALLYGPAFQLTKRASSVKHSPLRARGFMTHAFFQMLHAQNTEAIRYAQQALALTSELYPTRLMSYLILLMSYQTLGDFSRADEALAQAKRALIRCPDELRLGMQMVVLGHEANQHSYTGEYALAHACYQQMLTLAKEQPQQMRHIQIKLSWCYLLQDKSKEAKQALQAVMATEHQQLSRNWQVKYDLCYAQFHVHTGAFDQAHSLLVEVLDDARRDRHNEHLMQALNLLGEMYVRQDDVVQAKPLLAEAARAAYDRQLIPHAFHSLVQMAEAAFQQARYDVADAALGFLCTSENRRRMYSHTDHTLQTFLVLRKHHGAIHHAAFQYGEATTFDEMLTLLQ